MNGIQSKLKDKEVRRKKKLEKLLDSVISKDKLGIVSPEKVSRAAADQIMNGQIDLYISDSSNDNNSSSDEETF